MRSLSVFRPLQFAVSALVLGLVSVVPAQAQTFTVNGNSTAVQAELTIASLTSNQVVFTFKNVSSIASKLTGIGFDLNGGTFTKTSGPAAPFVFYQGPDNQVPQFNTAVLDFVLAIGANFNGGGNPNPGLDPTEISASYTIFSATNSFSGLSALDLANGVYIRFKAVDSPVQTSDVAHAPNVTIAAVPEPGEYAVGGMFLAGLMGLMVRARRKSASPTV